ncbi:hypothetical protein TrispH2_006300 [Trichoplax sp. H2]|nr:hypothetical protein TrispH2_006300 [Trichoplax sp. H2]|eukprot:RDD41624.1 hypothetical protein TrispH2_006300 [Trichoplax sp. H2]
MKKRALQLAKENVRNGDDNLSYWSMSECSTGATTTEYTYDVCQRFGKNEHDKFISVSNPDFGPLRIIGSENNGTQDLQIVIKDYQTSKIELKISPYTWIDSVEISADGRTVAFKSNEWIVHDIDKNKEIDFAKNEEGKVIKTDFCSLQFCPAVSETKVIMTLSKDRREVTIWKIEGNCIRPLNKRILCQYNIRYCQWVQVHDSVRVLLGWRNFNEFGKSRHTSDDPLNKINEWQIEIWHVQRWTCLSLKVPDYIHAKDDAYTGSNLETNGTIGLLKMKQFGKMEFENEFRPILHHIPRVENISVSDDQQMIFIYFARARDEYYRRSYMGTFDCRENKKLILKMRCCQVQSCVQVEQSGPPMLIPGSNRLLIYDRSQTHNVYEYNLQGNKIAWQDIPQSKSYDDLKRSEITVPESTVPETSVNIFNLQMIEFLGIEDCRKHRELIYQLLVKESNDTAFMYIRYRKKDNTLIFMQHKTILSQNWIITISLTTGKKIIDRPACIAKANIRYFDDDYLYAWECEEPNSNSYSFKCYKIGDGEYHMKLLQTIRYKHVERLIFKITMNYNSNGANYNPTIEQSSFSKEKVLVDAWGERDANMIANLPEKYRHENYFLLLENGDHIAIIARTNQLFMKRYKDNIKYFDSRTQFFNPENLWSDKHLILYEYDRVQSKFNIYNAQTLQLQIILPFTHFGVADIQWNLQQSQLIIKGFKDYCLVTVIE